MELPSKYCHNCGKPVPLAAKFCSSCGTSLASIDEKPPVPATQPVPNRIGPKVQTTFRPRVIGEDDDDDDVSLAADRVSSISELGISISSLDCDVRVDAPMKETVGGLVQQGKMAPPGGFAPETPRPAPALSNQDVLAQLQREAGTLRNR